VEDYIIGLLYHTKCGLHRLSGFGYRSSKSSKFVFKKSRYFGGFSPRRGDSIQYMPIKVKFGIEGKNTSKLGWLLETPKNK